MCVLVLQSLYKSKGVKDSEVSAKAEANADLILASLDKDKDGVLTEKEFVGVSSNEALVSLIFGIVNSS